MVCCRSGQTDGAEEADAAERTESAVLAALQGQPGAEPALGQQRQHRLRLHADHVVQRRRRRSHAVQAHAPQKGEPTLPLETNFFVALSFISQNEFASDI